MIEILASTRLQILLKLKERPHTISELSKALGFSKTTASYHLEKLEANGLVQRVERGKWVYYKITDQGLKSMQIKLIASIATLCTSFVSAVAIIVQVTKKIEEISAPTIAKEIKPLTAPSAPDYLLWQILMLAISAVSFILFLYFRR